MNVIEHLLACLAEEGGEVTQDATKALRFGLTDVNVANPTGPDNAHRIAMELCDIYAVAEMLEDEGALPPNWINREAIDAKKARVRHFMEYARQTGALQL